MPVVTSGRRLAIGAAKGICQGLLLAEERGVERHRDAVLELFGVRGFQMPEQDPGMVSCVHFVTESCDAVIRRGLCWPRC
jgi:hypothetical protein